MRRLSNSSEKSDSVSVTSHELETLTPEFFGYKTFAILPVDLPIPLLGVISPEILQDSYKVGVLSVESFRGCECRHG